MLKNNNNNNKKHVCAFTTGKLILIIKIREYHMTQKEANQVVQQSLNSGIPRLILLSLKSSFFFFLISPKIYHVGGAVMPSSDIKVYLMSQ